MAFRQPSCDGLFDLVETSRKEMIRVLDKAEAGLAGHASHNLLHFFPGAVLVIRAVYEEFWLGASLQVSEVRIIDGYPKADQLLDVSISTTNAEPDPAPKTESAHQKWNSGKFGRQKIDRGLDVASLSQPAVVLTGAQPRPTEIEPEYRDA